MVGRSTLYGVAAGGEAGASLALKIYHDEIHRVLALLGVNNLTELSPDHLLFADNAQLRAPLAKHHNS
jgi:(S)-mandelate dehydrogenase